jgi:glutamine synthetase
MLRVQVCDSNEKFERVPATLKNALDALNDDKYLVDALGKEIVAGFSYLKAKEWNQYMAHISHWEKDFYMNC